jgi:hypothetical protein
VGVELATRVAGCDSELREIAMTENLQRMKVVRSLQRRSQDRNKNLNVEVGL